MPLKVIVPLIISLGIGIGAYFCLQHGVSGHSLKIYVVDSSTGQGLKGVTVSVDNQVKTTNSEGRVTFHIEEGYYSIHLRKNGYKPKTWSTHVPLEKEWVKLDLVPS